MCRLILLIQSENSSYKFLHSKSVLHLPNRITLYYLEIKAKTLKLIQLQSLQPFLSVTVVQVL